MINIKLTIAETEYTDFTSINIERNISENNGTSRFKLKTNNYSGRLSNTFNLNDEVIVFTDKDATPTTKIFTGIIEDIQFSGEGMSESIILSGRDYGAVLQDMTVQPIVFKDRDAGEVAKIIVENNAEGVVTTNNIDVTTGTTLEKISFNHKNIYDALIQLAKLSDFIFYIDENKDINFVAKEGVSSGLTFDNTNTTGGSFRRNDSQIFNKVWVYGDRILTGATDVGGIGAGSVFTLTDKPSNTRVSVDSILQQPGGVFEMDNPAFISGLKYVVDFNEKNIIFVSGTAAGDNIPSSGISNVSVDYERKTPILKFNQDSNSIDSFGPKTKVITDTTIKDFSAANDRAVKFLADNKDEKIEGELEILGVLDVTPSQTAVVDLPNFDINNQTYQILSASYRFNKRNNLNESVLRLTVNKHIHDFTDTMKDILIRTQDLELGPLEGNLVRLEAATNNIAIQRHYEIWTKDINDNFVFHSNVHGRFEDPNSRFGTGELGSTFITSGGDF